MFDLIETAQDKLYSVITAAGIPSYTVYRDIVPRLRTETEEGNLALPAIIITFLQDSQTIKQGKDSTLQAERVLTLLVSIYAEVDLGASLSQTLQPVASAVGKAIRQSNNLNRLVKDIDVTKLQFQAIDDTAGIIFNAQLTIDLYYHG